MRFFDDELFYGEKAIVLDAYDGKVVVGGIKITCDGADELVEQIQIIENDFFQRFVYDLARKIREEIAREKTFHCIPAIINYYIRIPIAILIFDSKTNLLEYVAGDEQFGELKIHKESNSIIAQCFADGKRRIADVIGLSAQSEILLGHLSPFLVAPLKNDEIVGVVIASIKNTTRWQIAALTTLINEIGVYVENVLIVEKLRSEAQLDGFLQILDRIAFEQKVKEILSKRVRGKGAALLMIDLDNFKKFNDAKGHIEGDVLLKKVVNVIKKCKRSEDILGRYGGDEFCLFLQNIDSEGTRKVCERIVSKCARIEEGISCSIGAYAWSGNKTIEEVFKIADANLYKAKATKGTYFLSEERGEAKEKEVYDERIFAEFLKKCEESQKRYKIPFVLLKCDGQGDKILSLVRASDIVGHYEGKIAVILTNTTKKDAEIVRKRLTDVGTKVEII